MKNIIKIITLITLIFQFGTSGYSQNQINLGKSFDFGCSTEEQFEPLRWAISESKRTGLKELPKLRSDGWIYEFLKKENVRDSFFISPSLLKAQYFIMRHIPPGMLKKHIDCRVLNFNLKNENDLWYKELHQIQTTNDFLALIAKCPHQGIVWADSKMEENKMSYIELLDAIQQKKIRIYKFDNSPTPVTWPKNKNLTSDPRYKLLN